MLDIKENNVVVFYFFHILMPYNIILYFHLLIFMSQIVLYFLHSTSVLSFYIDVVLTLSIGTIIQLTSLMLKLAYSGNVISKYGIDLQNRLVL